MGDVSFELKYGKGSVQFTLPEKQVQEVIQGVSYPAIDNVQAAARQALNHPIASPPLREVVKEGDKVVVLVSDITRGWQKMHQVLPVMLEELNAGGVADKDVTIIIAIGGHRKNTEAEFKELCGEEIYKRVKIVNHDSRDKDNMVYLGKTSRGTEVSVSRTVAEADKVVMTGGVIYHYMVGYGGGRKSILPGIAALETIQQNHLHALNKEVGTGSNPMSNSKITKGNAAHEDMMEIAAFVQPDFLINMVPNTDGDYAGIFTGNWVAAWQEATNLVDQIYGISIKNKSDIVIATCGGYPKDINLYQTGKTMDNASYAVKEGGVVIILSECPDIMEPKEFTGWFNFGSLLEMEKGLRANFTIPGWCAFRELECNLTAKYILLTKSENAEFVKKTGMTPATTIEEALELALKHCNTDNPTYTVMPQGANTLPLLKE